MLSDSIIWDLDEDPNGNVQHCAEHGVTKQEVEQVFANVVDIDVSRSSGCPIAFGNTDANRHLVVVYDQINENTVYPITAYEVSRRKKP